MLVPRLPVGGHNFTSAIADSFKISYAKAEKLKQEGATGKYAKQVMQAMRPVFTELLESVQRSLEYYQTNAELDTMIGVGSTFRIPGLRKFLGTQLQKKIHRLDEFRKIRVEGPEAADFATSTVNLWTAYGLALQEIGGADVTVNLAPAEVLRQQMWSAKRGWFVAAASIAFLTGAAMFGRYFIDSNGLRSGSWSSEVSGVENTHRSHENRLASILSKATGGSFASSLLSLDDYRAVWPALSDDVTSAVAAGNDSASMAGGLAIQSVEPGKLAVLENFGGAYRDEGNGPQATRYIDVSLDVAYSNSQPDYLNTTVCAWLRDQEGRDGSPIRILSDTISFNPSAITKVTVKDDGSTSSEGGSGGRAGGSKGNNRGSGSASGGRGGSEGASGGSFGNISGSGSGGAGRTVQQGEKIDSGGGGTLFGSGGSGSGFQGAESTDNSGDDYGTGRGERGGSSAGREDETSLGDLNALAPIPPEPPVFEPGSTYYRGLVTFTVEILDASAEASDEGEN